MALNNFCFAHGANALCAPYTARATWGASPPEEEWKWGSGEVEGAGDPRDVVGRLGRGSGSHGARCAIAITHGRGRGARVPFAGVSAGAGLRPPHHHATHPCWCAVF